MNLKERRKEYMKIFGWKKGKEKHYNHIAIQKSKVTSRNDILMVSFQFIKI